MSSLSSHLPHVLTLSKVIHVGSVFDLFPNQAPSRASATDIPGRSSDKTLGEVTTRSIKIDS
jgi:hypothetical protein